MLKGLPPNSISPEGRAAQEFCVAISRAAAGGGPRAQILWSNAARHSGVGGTQGFRVRVGPRGLSHPVLTLLETLRVTTNACLNHLPSPAPLPLPTNPPSPHGALDPACLLHPQHRPAAPCMAQEVCASTAHADEQTASAQACFQDTHGFAVFSSVSTIGIMQAFGSCGRAVDMLHQAPAKTPRPAPPRPAPPRPAPPRPRSQPKVGEQRLVRVGAPGVHQLRPSEEGALQLGQHLKSPRPGGVHVQPGRGSGRSGRSGASRRRLASESVGLVRESASKKCASAKVNMCVCVQPASRLRGAPPLLPGSSGGLALLGALPPQVASVWEHSWDAI